MGNLLKPSSECALFCLPPGYTLPTSVHCLLDKANIQVPLLPGPPSPASGLSVLFALLRNPLFYSTQTGHGLYAFPNASPPNGSATYLLLLRNLVFL